MDLARTPLHALHERAAQLGERPALWTRRGRTWRSTSWRVYAARVRHFALGLHALGFGPGSTLALLASNREEWVVAHLAAMALGGTPLGLYTTSSADQVERVLARSEAGWVLVESPVHLAMVLARRERLPHLRRLLVMEGPAPLPEGALTWGQVMEAGEGALDEGPYRQQVEALVPERLATLLYTAGPGGQPRGVMLSHRNLAWMAQRLARTLALDAQSVALCALPLAHVAEQLLCVHVPLLLGAQVYFPHPAEERLEALRAVRPSVYFAVPHAWAQLRERAEEVLAAQPAPQQALAVRAREAAAAWHAHRRRGEPVPLPLELRYEAARRLVLGPLQHQLGLERVRYAACAAAPLGRELADFFASLDVVVHEVYGQTEASGPIALEVPGASRPGTVGQPMLGVEVRIAPDGEVLVRGGGVCLGYFQDAAASARLLAGGWLHTGDLGRLDAQGFLRLTGRKRERVVTSGGRKTDPTHIEALLRAALPGVAEALVVGERRDFLVALLALDPERALALARERGWPADVESLAQDERVRAWLLERIEREVNPRLARFEAVRRIALLPGPLGAPGEGKARRRRVLEARHAPLIEQLYAQR